MKKRIFSILLVLNVMFLCVATVFAAQSTPFASIKIPGVLQVEDYDLGGPGVAYQNNSSGNEGGAYRTDDADIYSNAQGYTMGANNGEWYVYTVNIAKESVYDVNVVYATPQGTAEITLFCDEKEGIRQRLPATGNWINFTELSIGTIALPKGTHKIKFLVSRDSYSIDSIKFTDALAENTTIDYSKKTGAYKNLYLPTIIQAEDFDLQNGSGYYSVDGVNNSKEYRKNDGIDISKKSDSYHIKLMQNEWVNYTFKVEKSAIFKMKIAALSTGSLDISFDGNKTVSNLTISNKENEIDICNIYLEKGTHTVRLLTKSASFSMDYIRFSSSSGEAILPDSNIDAEDKKEEIKEEIQNKIYKKIYVSQNGSDQNDGTSKLPFKTIEAAQKEVQKIKKDMDGDILVLIDGGEYSLEKTLVFSEKDSGENGFNVIYKSLNSLDKPILSGGEKVENWEKENNFIYKAKLDTKKEIRQLYIGGNRAVRARSKYMYKADRSYIHSETKQEDGFTISKGNFPDIKKPKDLELVWNIEWTNQRVAVSDILDYDDKNKLILMEQPYYSWARTKEYSASSPNPQRNFYLENAKELLDEPGEFYYDKDEKQIYYYPFSEESLNQLDCYVGTLEYMLALNGADKTNKAQNIVFDGILFKYGTWLEPNEKGFCVFQGESIVSGDGLKDKILPAQIQINNADNIQIKNCNFENLGSVAIGLRNGVSNCDISGNVFKDISAAAITVGDWQHNRPTGDMQMCVNNKIANNFIVRPSQEYFSSPAISAYYVQGLEILQNDIKDCPYSGISLGWGWGENVEECRNNSIIGNKIENILTCLKDGAHIYTLGPMKDTVISKNHLIRSLGDSRGGLYTDQGSGYMTLSQNVIEKCNIWMYIWTDSIHDLIIKDNFSDTDSSLNNGVDNTFTNNTVVTDGNWPQNAIEIMNKAGTGKLLTQYELPEFRQGLVEAYPRKVFSSKNAIKAEAEDFSDFYKTGGGNVSVYSIITGKGVGDTVAGDWLSYNVNSTDSRNIGVYLNYANAFDLSQPQPKVAILVNGEKVIDNFSLVNTKEWTNYQEIKIGDIELKKGNNEIKVMFLENGFAFDYIKLSEKSREQTDTDFDEGIYVPQKKSFIFSDIKGHWAEDSIIKCAKKGIILGKSEEIFAPNDYVTYNQAQILNQRISKSEEIKSIASDYEVTRQEFAYLIADLYYQMKGAYKIEFDNEAFSDFSEIAPVFKTAVLAVKSLGLMVGDSDNQFDPTKKLTRAEACTVYAKLLQENIYE